MWNQIAAGEQAAAWGQAAAQAISGGAAGSFALGVLVVAFGVAGAAKLGHPGRALAAMRGLGVPARLQRQGFAHALPVAELLLALALGLTGGAVRAAAVLCAFGALLAFTVLLVRVLRRGEAVDCDCFGALSAGRPVTWRSVARNLLLMLAAGTVLVSPPAGLLPVALLRAGPVAALGVVTSWALLLVLVLFLQVRGLRRKAGQASASAGRGEDPGSAAEASPSPAGAPPLLAGASAPGAAPCANCPVPAQAAAFPSAGRAPARMGDRIPDAELLHEDFTAVPLARLGGDLPVLLLFLSPSCPPCREAALRLAGWSEAIAPVALRVASTATPRELREELPEAVPFSLHAAGWAKHALGVKGTPSAVLLGGGVERVVASPVVEGMEQIEMLVESLLAARGESRVNG
jgi:thiol-disulfide isomerase/thioredoxin